MNRIFMMKSSGLILFLYILTGCKQNNQNQAYQQGPAELPFGIVQKGEAVVSKEYSASIEGVSNVEIRAQVTGYLSKIYVDEGDYVNAGQTLFKIEERPYAEQLNTARASLSSAQSNLTNAQIDLNRKKELVSSKIVSELQVQEAQTVYNAARAAVEQASSLVESAKINLNFCTVKAPVSGYIGRFNYRLGSLISPSNSTPLTLLSDVHKVNVYFSMSENDFLTFQNKYEGNSIDDKLKAAPPVNLIISNGEKYELQGQIDAVEGQFNPSTGSITLRAKFDNPETILRSGNTGKIVLEERFADVLLIPVASTMMIQDRVFIFSVEKEGKAVQIPIEVKGKSGDNYIVSGGVKEGEQYIVTGFDRLQPGALVVQQKENKEKNHKTLNTQK